MFPEMVDNFNNFNITSYRDQPPIKLFRSSSSSSSPLSLSKPLSSSSSSSSSPPSLSGLPWNEPYEIDNNDFAVPVYGYLTPIFVIITMTTNFLVCAVLMRRPMRSCTNMVLTSLAVSDALTGLWPLPCFVYFYTFRNHVDYLRYDWCFVFFCLTDYLPTASHTASVWLTVLLAVQRYLHVCHPVVAKRLCTITRTLKVIGVTYAVAVATQLCRLIDGTFVPISVQSKIDFNENITACTYLYHPVVEAYINIYFGIFYWFRVLFVHIIPCLVLVSLNSALVQVITSAQRKRKRLISNRTNHTKMQQLRSNKSQGHKLNHEPLDMENQVYNEPSGSNQQSCASRCVMKSNIKTENMTSLEIESTHVEVKCSEEYNTRWDREFLDANNSKRENCNRKSHKKKNKLSYRNTKAFKSSTVKRHGNNSTTMMLIVVVCLFLLVELPLASLFILNFIDNTWTLELLSKTATDTATLFMNSITIVSYSFNFFVYCAMSNQFRRHFRDLFCVTRMPDKREWFILPTISN